MPNASEPLERIEFTLTAPPARGNQRGHWGKHYRAQAAWEQLAGLELARQRIRYPKEPWKRTRVRCHFQLADVVDPDNLGSRRKLILDLLKEHWAGIDRNGRLRLLSKPRDNPRDVKAKDGFFPDDGPEHVELVEPSQEKLESSDEPRVRVVLERLE